MSDLQIGLFIIGALVILGVLAYNKWQERQHRKTLGRFFPSPEEDILLRQTVSSRKTAESPDETGRRLEPQILDPDFSIPPEISPETPAGPDFSAEETRYAPSFPEEKTPSRLNLPVPFDLLSPGIDAIAVIEAPEPLATGQIFTFHAEFLQKLKKPLRWVGFNEIQGIWESVTEKNPSSYRRLRAGLQLADRTGPVSENDFFLFTGAMRRLAEKWAVDIPTSQTMLEQARQLDQFCTEVDIQIGMNLICRGTPFPGTKIRALAESTGMALCNDGTYTRFDENGLALFSLQNFEASGFATETLKSMSTPGLVFLLDVPRTPRGQFVYKQMVDTAKRFAETLEGMLVDDNRRPLEEAQFARICQEFVIRPQAVMEAAGLPAGGSLALRLFN